MTEFASIGDIIECKVQEPYPQLLRVRLLNEESCAYANHLIAVGRWRKVTEGELKDENRCENG